MTAQLVSQVETGVVYVLILGALFVVKGAAAELKKVGGHVNTFVVAHTTEKERALLDTLVQDAVPYVKTLYPALDPAGLIQKATDHVTALAVQKGLNFNPQEVSAAVGGLLSVLQTPQNASIFAGPGDSRAPLGMQS